MATKRRNPQNNPRRDPQPKRVDPRYTWTLKGDFDPEFKAQINAAGAKVGLTQAKFVKQTMTREAQRILKGEPEPAAGQPPALLESELVRALAGLSARLDELEAQQARSWWQRVRGLLRGGA
jgi:hypothetical protein